MKSFTAILFSMLLLLTPFASLQTLASPCPLVKKACCHPGCQMACCKQQPSDSQPPPALPSPKNGPENQLAWVTLAMVIGNVPEPATDSLACDKQTSLTVAPTPLYTRHCTLLL